MTRTCEHCSTEFDAQGSWRGLRRFCSPECAWADRRGQKGPNKKRTSPALAAAISEMLRSDPFAQDRFNTLVGRSVF